MLDKNRLKARLRAFSIWQKLGFLPWSKPKVKKRKGDFYKGAFNSIPFLNDDAKRTFVHLLLRPGYMIRDYINGQHERYLAPLTSLIIFYAFFALVSSILHPSFTEDSGIVMDVTPTTVADTSKTAEAVESLSGHFDKDFSDEYLKANETVANISMVFTIWSLDRHPEMVDTPFKASLAELERSLRSQGVYLFLGNFIFLWIAMCLVLKKKGMGSSACAATAAYVLCQFCFFMFFSLFLSGHKGEIGVGLMGLLLMFDYHQLFDLGWKKSFRLSVKTGIFYGLAAVCLTVILLAIAFLVYLATK